MKSFVEKLSEILEKNKVVNHKESLAMQKAFRDREKAQFDDFLLEEGLVQESDLLEALSEYYQVPVLDTVGYLFDHNLVTKFPKDFLLREAIIPVQVDEGIMSVVASNPKKEGLESFIRNYVSYDIVLMVGLRRDICDAVKEFYDISPSSVEQVEEMEDQIDRERAVEEIEEGSESILKD